MILETKPKDPLEVAFDEKERAKHELDEAIRGNLYSAQRVLNALVRSYQWQQSFDSIKALAEGKALDQIEMARIAGKLEYVKHLVELRDSIIQEDSKDGRHGTGN